jgi:hypothetical protein
MILIGAILGVSAVFLQDLGESFIFKFFMVLIEPASWFSIWEGMNQIFFENQHLKREFEFYNKLERVQINFVSY